jgi:uncharacterized protein (DUF2141 family)
MAKPIEKTSTGAIMVTGPGIKLYRFLVRKQALALEIKGIKMTRGRTAYSICKEVYGFKGSRQRVFDQMEELAAKINPDNIDELIKTSR